MGEGGGPSKLPTSHFRRPHHLQLQLRPSATRTRTTRTTRTAHSSTDPVAMSAPDPKEAWQRLQNELTRRGARFGGSGGGAPKGLGGGVASLVLLGGGIWLANNALFNGASSPRVEEEVEKKNRCAWQQS